MQLEFTFVIFQKKNSPRIRDLFEVMLPNPACVLVFPPAAARPRRTGRDRDGHLVRNRAQPEMDHPNPISLIGLWSSITFYLPQLRTLKSRNRFKTIKIYLNFKSMY
jgi:hypothetical protein